jgi:hypothetical protein
MIPTFYGRRCISSLVASVPCHVRADGAGVPCPAHGAAHSIVPLQVQEYTPCHIATRNCHEHLGYTLVTFIYIKGMGEGGARLRTERFSPCPYGMIQ